IEIAFKVLGNSFLYKIDANVRLNFLDYVFENFLRKFKIDFLLQQSRMEDQRVQHALHITEVGVDTVGKVLRYFRWNFDSIRLHLPVYDRELRFEVRFL